MIARITALLDTLRTESKHQAIPLTQTERQLASAALLVEVATIDQCFDASEMQALARLLTQQFSLDTQEVNALIDKAKHSSAESSSLYEFTQLINAHCNEVQKYELACHLWEVAYADGELDKYEEHIIRRIADLIYLRHSDFIKAKHYARDQQG